MRQPRPAFHLTNLQPRCRRVGLLQPPRAGVNALPPRPAADLCTTSGARWTKTVTDAPVRIRRAFDVICGFELDGGVSDGAVLGEDLRVSSPARDATWRRRRQRCARSRPPSRLSGSRCGGRGPPLPRAQRLALPLPCRRRSRGCDLHEDPQGLAHQVPSAGQDEQPDRDRDDRVDEAESREREVDRADDDPIEPSMAEHLEVGAL